MKKLIGYLKGYEVESILAPLFKMLEALLDLFVPIVVAKIIDVGIPSGDKAHIIKLVLLMVLLALLGLASSITAQFFAAKASVGFSTALRKRLFCHIENFSCSELDTLGGNTLITRLTSDILQVQTGVNMTLRLLLRSPFIVFGSMIMAFTIDFKLAMIFVVTIPVLSLVVYGIMIISIPLYKKVQASLDSILGKTRENLTGVRVVRAFCKEKQEIEAFDERNDKLTRINEFVGRISALLNPVTFLLINIATIVLIYNGAIRVNVGDVGQGEVVALYNYMAQMIIELVKLSSLIITINRGLACGERVLAVLDIDPGMKYKDGPWVDGVVDSVSGSVCGLHNTDGTDAWFAGEGLSLGLHNTDATDFWIGGDGADSGLHKTSIPAVEFDHVCLTYAHAGAESLSDISFTAYEGETIGVIGGTGSGKSSLVNLIPRFYDATKGSVKVFGRDVKDYPRGDLSKVVSIVLQKAVLFKGSIRANMKMGKEDATDSEIYKALEIAQALDVVKSKGGLDHDINQGGRNLSGGQRQRLTIARALVADPKILIMDDSASALDFATDAALRKAVGKLPMTVFIVSQRASSVMNADKIIVLDDGELKGLGSHDELMKDNEIYREIYYSQFPPERKEGA
ncbi:MAG: ABC transporter ATP-binding protein/permease [Lachnospiraceae bacterium]|nr:ABC transporter ATP-binding protein/permease [Lachnospiraceae bacterium]